MNEFKITDEMFMKHRDKHIKQGRTQAFKEVEKVINKLICVSNEVASDGVIWIRSKSLLDKLKEAQK